MIRIRKLTETKPTKTEIIQKLIYERHNFSPRQN